MSDEHPLEKSLAVIQALHMRTRERKVDWRETTDPLVFRADSGDFILQIRQIPDKDYPDQPDYALDVINKKSGRKIETISNATLRPVMDRKTLEGLSPYGVFQQTYDIARRQALKVDDALEDILKTLKKLP